MLCISPPSVRVQDEPFCPMHTAPLVYFFQIIPLVSSVTSPVPFCDMQEECLAGGTISAVVCPSPRPEALFFLPTIQTQGKERLEQNSSLLVTPAAIPHGLSKAWGPGWAGEALKRQTRICYFTLPVLAA